MRIVDIAEMKKIEMESFEKFQFNETLIIENVGIKAADFIHHHVIEDHAFSEIVALIGPGNNGSDALAIARHLVNLGHVVRAFDLFPNDKKGSEIEQQLNLARNFGVKISKITDVEQLESYFMQTQSSYLVIDGILGTGVRLPLSNYLFDVINVVNHHSTITVAIDIPTGITGDHGIKSGNAIEAHFTLAIGFPKLGHFSGQGPHHCGEIITIDAGFPQVFHSQGDKFLLTEDGVVSVYQSRDKFAHKNSFGHCLVVGGSRGLTGALMMAGLGAIKVGTGLVTTSTWEENYYELSTRSIPEIMTGIIPVEEQGEEEIIRKFGRYDSMVIGPGLGRSEQSRTTVLKALLHFQGPMVVDADALRVLNLNEMKEVVAPRRAATVLTPHAGEFAALMNCAIQEVLDRPVDWLKKAVDELNCCIVLKGPVTYIAFPNGELAVNYFPNDGMASGGSGDVLAGIIGGLLAQNAEDPKESGLFAKKGKTYETILLAVMAHTLAGKHAAEKEGVRAMTAMSIIDHLSDAFFELDQQRESTQA
ncbi:MAG: NAD(P)H-hydrate dehydratase [Bdellovibrio sp.]